MQNEHYLPYEDRGFTKVRPSTIHGLGVFAIKPIPKGTRLFEYAGKRISRDQIIQEFMKGITSCLYVMDLNETTVIDAERGGNEARFINHHCHPNCEIYYVNETPFVYAVETIPENLEIFYDYQLSFICEPLLTKEEKRQLFPCNCSAKNCRGTMLWRK